MRFLLLVTLVLGLSHPAIAQADRGDRVGAFDVFTYTDPGTGIELVGANNTEASNNRVRLVLRCRDGETVVALLRLVSHEDRTTSNRRPVLVSHAMDDDVPHLGYWRVVPSNTPAVAIAMRRLQENLLERGRTAATAAFETGGVRSEMPMDGFSEAYDRVDAHCKLIN